MKPKFLIMYLFLFYTGIAVQAQNRITRDFKYSASVDMLGLFNSGYPDKVIFKIFNFDKNAIKGAWRFGLASNYRMHQIEVQNADNKLFQTSNKENALAITPSFGYEWRKQSRNLTYYSGLDFIFSVNKINTSIATITGPSKSISNSFGIIPYIGFEYKLTTKITTSIELGIYSNYSKHSHWMIEQPFNKIKTTSFTSDLKLPYSLTLNYNI